MNKDNLMRRALWISVVYNLGGALLFAFPSSLLVLLAGLPPTVPPIYCALLALFVFSSQAPTPGSPSNRT
jgi:hypothetical protein